MPVTAGVFLETQLFVTNNYDFDRRAFAELIDRVKEDRGRVFLTSVTVGEVKRRIQVQVKEAIRFSEVRKYLKVLANSNVPEIRARSERLFPEPVTDELVKQFEDFLEKTKATIIDCSGVNPELVFQQYFELKLPFQEKKDKRHEFPDAFAIEALKDFSRSEGRDIVVITGDQGFRTVCETHGMTVLETVEKFPDKEIAEREPKISAHVLPKSSTKSTATSPCLVLSWWTTKEKSTARLSVNSNWITTPLWFASTAIARSSKYLYTSNTKPTFPTTIPMQPTTTKRKDAPMYSIPFTKPSKKKSISRLRYKSLLIPTMNPIVTPRSAN